MPSRNDDNNYISNNDNRSPLGDILGGILAIAITGSLGYSAIKSGAAKPVISKIIKNLGEYKGGNFSAYSQGLKTWSESNGYLKNSAFRTTFMDTMKMMTSKEGIGNFIRETKIDIKDLKEYTKLASNKQYIAKGTSIARSSDISDIIDTIDTNAHWLYSNPEFVESYKNIKAIKSNLIFEHGYNEHDTMPVVDKMHQELIKRFTVTAKEQAESFKQIGYRKLTLGDTIGKDLYDILDKKTAEALGGDLNTLVQHMGYDTEKWKNLYWDKDLLIDEKGTIKDLRGTRNAIRNSLTTMSDEFRVPFIGINPMKLFYTDRIIKKPKPLFSILEKGTVQFGVTGTKEKIEENLFFIKGNVFKADNFNDPIATGVHLEDINAATSVTARFSRMMAGINLKEFHSVDKQDHIRNIWSKVAKKLDIGFQDIEGNEFNFFKPATYTAVLGKMFNGPLKTHGGAAEAKTLDMAFGANKGYFAMKDSVKLRDVINPKSSTNSYTYFKQFFHGRDSLKEVTPLTLVPFAFVERLNEGLASAFVGMSSNSTKNAWDSYKNLVTKRIVPILAGKAVWDFANYELENLTNHEPKDVVADAYVNAKINFASLKDLIGITDLSKRVAQLLPGGEQITDLPGLNALDLTKSKQDLIDYYTSGEDTIRKGRYWDLGNTPLTGNNVESSRANWYRRMKSDWQYTDTLYGSKEEYWNNKMNPIKHYITDPNWLAEKHYKDRPYPIVGGYQELEAIPLFGHLLNSTIGQLLNPDKKLHEEYWKDNQLVPLDNSYGVGSTVSGIVDGKVVQPDINNDVSIDDTQTTIEKSNTSSIAITENNKTLHTGSLPLTLNDKKLIPEEEVTPLIYTTTGGGVKIVEAPGKADIRAINEAIKTQSLSKSVRGVKNKFNGQRFPEAPMNETPPTTNPFEKTGVDITEMGGIYGFTSATVAPVMNEEWSPEIASTYDMASMTDSFWESSIGGIGGDISEIYRRFMPKDKNQAQEYNPIKNTQAEWLPGADYYLNFKVGDPYTKNAYGEIRLPGEAYEKINNMGDVMALPIDAAMIGMSKDTLVSSFFHDNDVEVLNKISSEHAWKQAHNNLKSQFKNLLIDSDTNIVDDTFNYKGHYDARIIDPTSPNKESLVIIKGVTANEYESMKTKDANEEHSSELNLYLHSMKLTKGYVMYYNQEDKRNPIGIVKEVNYDPDKFNKQMQNLEEARNTVKSKIESGQKQRGDLYDYVERFKILADIAPWSQNLKSVASTISLLPLDEQQKAFIQQSKDQAKEQKTKNRFYNYKYATANLKYETVTVTKVIDSNTFMTAEHPDNPIKLAGIHVSTDKNKKETQIAQELISKTIYEGASVQIGYDLDEANQIARDTYKTIHSIVNKDNMHLTNLNKQLLDKGLSTEKETDDSPTGINARYSQLEILLGSTWEKIAHMNTIVNTKLLQVRSPLEMYERKEVFGKSFASWEHPFEDYLMPMLHKAGNRNPVFATAMGIVAGSLFGGKSAYGRVVGAVIGGALTSFSSIHAKAVELSTGKRWIPEYRRKERNLNEYVDMLKYIKAQKLYADYSKQALDKEGFNVQEYMDKKKLDGEARTKEAQDLMVIKRAIQQGDKTWEEGLKESGLEYETEPQDKKEAMKIINKKINEIKSFREVEKIPTLALKAISYYQQSKKTMYGYEPGDPVMDFFVSLPKKEREYFQGFLEAPEEEKPEILSIAPNYMRRALESAWGMAVEDKTELTEYFKEHQLPSSTWEGWNEDSNLDVVKVKLIKNEALTPTEFGIWPEDENIAEQQSIRAPKMNIHEKATTIKRKLEDLLKELGLEEINVSIDKTTHGNLNVEMDIKQNNKNEIEKYLDEHGHKLLS